ncbi:MAG: hypothetical protein A2017_15520 [Lentisphaerae bacterium GWF2_44_16]|nr:MAG: hypothetical protein A2017_15520 [Lentisphaerae bacterium GWF2_44_16]
MNIYVVADLEGISGIVNFDQTGRDGKGAEYERARHLLTEEVNTVVSACTEAGAEKIIVMDGHSSGYNFIVEKLHPGGEYIVGTNRKEVFPGLSKTKFDGLILLGYHAMAGTENALLDHTQSSTSWYDYQINGIKMGEIGQAAVYAGLFNVPVILVTGDQKTCEEASSLLPGVETVTVKKALSRICGQIIPPLKAREMISEGVKRALGKIKSFSSYTIKMPARVKITFQTTDSADIHERNGWKRVGGTSVEKDIEEIKTGFELR